MFQTPASSITGTSRRSTRVSRSASGVTTETFGRSTAKKSTSKATNFIKSQTAKGPVKKWARILREPAKNIGFKCMTWVPVEELTFDEKILWDEQQQKMKGSKDKNDVNSSSKGAEERQESAVSKTEEKSMSSSNNSMASGAGAEADIDESVNTSQYSEQQPPTKRIKIDEQDSLDVSQSEISESNIADTSIASENDEDDSQEDDSQEE